MLDSGISKLPAYLKSVQNKPFKWGEHDCLIFTNQAFREMCGEGWAEDWLGRYMRDGFPLKRKELQDEFGYRTFTEAVDKRLQRIEGVPPRGSLVTTKKARRWVIGSAMGISVGLKAAFVSKHGLVYHPIETIDKAWIRT
jgi:hypothetical protein